MKYYAKITGSTDKEQVRGRFLDAGADKPILDGQTKQKQPDSTYSNLKNELLTTHEPLMIDSLFSIGKNAREITKELEWFRQHDIEIYVLDIPSTMEADPRNVDMLSELNSVYAAREIEKLKEGQKKAVNAEKRSGKVRERSPGRPRVPYPDNWVKEYDKWQAKETSSAEFRAAVGLSQGTFYNFLRQYKEDLLHQEEQKIGSESERGAI